MPRVHPLIGALAVATLLAGSSAPAAEPLFTLGDEGRTFLYRARPGDLPAIVAEQFGVQARDLPAFLAANGIGDATRVGPGFVYRIPNAPARALEGRTAALQAENARLTREATEAAGRERTLTHEVSESQAGAATAEERATHLARLESLWPLARAACVLLVLLAGAAAAVAAAALRRQRQATRYARTLAVELEEKRRTALAERQESARRILDLETRVRTLESQLGPRVVIGGRGGSAS